MTRLGARFDEAFRPPVTWSMSPGSRAIVAVLAAAVFAAFVAGGCGNPNGTSVTSPPASAAASTSAAQSPSASTATLAPSPSPPGPPSPVAGGAGPGGTPTGSLAAMLPERLAGRDLTRFAVSGADFVKLAADAGAAGVGDFLRRLGRTTRDLSAAVAFDQSGTVEGEIAAIRVAHTSGAEIVSAFLAAERRTLPAGISVGVRVVAGKRVTVITAQGDAAPAPAYVYARGDVAFLVQVHDVRVAEAALKALP